MKHNSNSDEPLCGNMYSPPPPLPSELWVQVFGFLPPSDRLQVRAVCKHFRRLMDGSALWRDWTVKLSRVKGYNRQFWLLLRRWRVTSATLTSLCGLKQIAAELPRLRTLTLDGDSGSEGLDALQSFTNLERLDLKRPKGLKFDRLFFVLPPTLTHLGVCDPDHSSGAFWESLDVSSFESTKRLTNLTSFVCHCSFAVEPEALFPILLSALPQLTHLSVVGPLQFCGRPVHGRRETPSLQHRSLSSLEIIEYFHDLPHDLMKKLPSLRSLALFFSSAYRVSEKCPISRWLKDLTSLSSLLVVGGLQIRDFVGSLPPSVTHLVLRDVPVNAAEMVELSFQLPKLLHLHLEPRGALGSDTALLPRLFPDLRSLRVRLERVPPEDFLHLNALTQLQQLQMLDPVPPPAPLVSRFQELTKNRVRISQRPRPNRPQTCKCIRHLPTESWD